MPALEFQFREGGIYLPQLRLWLDPSAAQSQAAGGSLALGTGMGSIANRVSYFGKFHGPITTQTPRGS